MNYCGWQKQLGDDHGGAHSIQQTIEEALAKMTGETMSIVGSGRTDSGVHSAGQVAHFRLAKKEWDPEILKRGLNSHLPIDIRIARVQRVPMEFHAQRSAEKKQYGYTFQQGPCPLPLLEPYTWWIHKRLDTAALEEALGYLRGEHDFKPFQARGAKLTTTVRSILEARVIEEPIGFPAMTPVQDNEFRLVRIRLVGTGFLKQMVRGIAGTLLQIGDGRRPATDMRKILESGDRALVGQTAPARALCLERVWYPGLDW
jgi:tRNA pseudouridine38-40 synthase